MAMDEKRDCPTAEGILQNTARHVNCLSEENRNTRKRAIQAISKEILGQQIPLTGEVLQLVLKELIKPLLKIVSDPVEKCRELAIIFVSDSMKLVTELHEFLSYIMPVLVQRLGQKEITEPSEELRLLLVELLTTIVRLIDGQKLSVYLGDMVVILQNTILDPFSEVKKESCRCASMLSKAVPQQFHMQSESLIKPLSISISHQHSRVRVEVVNAIGNVVLYGNGKSVDDVVSHLAQRLFDEAPPVRAAVTKVVGHWLLDLPDRYSFHHKLIPLLLTSLTDEIPDIRIQAEALWHDIGLKYEQENEEELKDRQDFVKADPDHYPTGLERPNLGCRQLVYRHFSKILPGLLRDLGDWVVATRIKSAKLLYSLLLNEEENITQLMEKLLSGLYKACGDEETEVVKYVVKSAELVGYFVSPEVWCKMVLQAVKTTQSSASVKVLAAIIRGSSKEKLHPYLKDVAQLLADPHICQIAEVLNPLLDCVDGLVSVSREQCQDVSLHLFTVLITSMAIHKPNLSSQANHLLGHLAEVQGMKNTQALFEQHTLQVLNSLQEGYVFWTQHSVDRLVFETLVVESGAVVGQILEEIIPILTANLKPEKDPEVRLKMFSLLSSLLTKFGCTKESQQRFEEFTVVVIKDMIIPNFVWKAGRIASTVRTAALACLWSLFSSGHFSKEKLLEVADELLSQVISLLEDDNKTTRLISCRVLMRMFSLGGTDLDQDRLHNLYPDLLKRLDDSSEDIRVAMAKTFLAYFDCFQDGYNASLYRSHLEAIYKGLLVHLDDPNERIQDAVLETLLKAARLMPEMLLQEIEDVRHKHRSLKYCDQLVHHIHNLPKQS